MAHLLDKMMYAGEVPWHGLGIPLPDRVSSDVLRELVFDWTVEEEPIYTARRPIDGRPGTPLHDVVPAYRALRRSDNRAILAVMPTSYGVVDYADCLALLDAAEEPGATKYLTAGTLDGGRRGWALATIPSSTVEVAGAELKPYLLLSSSHDGSLAIRVHFTSVYVVCNNTLTGALSEAGVTARGKQKRLPNVLTVRHTKNVKQQVERAAQVIAGARRYFGAFHETALRLANQRWTLHQMAGLVTDLFPLPETVLAERHRGELGVCAAERARQRVCALFEGAQRAADCAPGTRWAAFNAVTEFIDHGVERRAKTAHQLAERRFDGIMFGSGAAIRQRALDHLLAAV